MRLHGSSTLWLGVPHPALDAASLVGQVIGPFLFAASMFSYVPVVRLSPVPAFCADAIVDHVSWTKAGLHASAATPVVGQVVVSCSMTDGTSWQAVQQQN